MGRGEEGIRGREVRGRGMEGGRVGGREEEGD